MEKDQSRPTYAYWLLQPIILRQNWLISLYEPKLEHSVDDNFSLDDDFRSGFWNVNHHYRHQSFSGLHSSDDQITLSHVNPRYHVMKTMHWKKGINKRTLLYHRYFFFNIHKSSHLSCIYISNTWCFLDFIILADCNETSYEMSW